MTIHVVCRDCTFEGLTEDTDEAVRMIDNHESETGHDVDDGRVDDETRLVTDGGESIAVQVGQFETVVYPNDTVEDLFERIGNTTIDIDTETTALCRPFSDGRRPTPPEDDQVIPFDLEGVEYGDKLELYRLPVSERPAYDDGTDPELVTDGGKPTLALTDDGLEIPEGVSLADGVVVRARGATVDHKPGSEEQSFYPMIDQRHLHAEGREAVNDQLADDEVTVKQYGEDAETYRVVIPETDGADESGDDDFEAYEEALDELNDGLLEAYAAGFAKGVEFAEADPGLTTDVEALKKKEPVQESHFHYWEGRQKPLEGWLREHFTDDEQAVTDGGNTETMSNSTEYEFIFWHVDSERDITSAGHSHDDNLRQERALRDCAERFGVPKSQLDHVATVETAAGVDDELAETDYKYVFIDGEGNSTVVGNSNSGREQFCREIAADAMDAEEDEITFVTVTDVTVVMDR